jgi:hypothetical protein
MRNKNITNVNLIKDATILPFSVVHLGHLPSLLYRFLIPGELLIPFGYNFHSKTCNSFRLSMQCDTFS